MTGYTGELVRKNLDFKGFAMCCAHAFDALMGLRDEGIDAEVPEEFKPSEYHPKEMEEIKAEFSKWAAMTHDEESLYFKKKQEDEIGLHMQLRKERLDRKKVPIMAAMLDKVQSWNPPSKDHYGLKDFMVQQLVDSIKSDTGTEYYDEVLAKLEVQSIAEYRAICIAQMHKDLAYHAKSYAEEVERVNERNKWIRELRESLAVS